VNYTRWGLSRLAAEVWWRRERRARAPSALDDKCDDDGEVLGSVVHLPEDVGQDDQKHEGRLSFTGVAWRVREKGTGWKGEGWDGARNDPLTINNRWVFRSISCMLSLCLIRRHRAFYAI
jgi:hypothetical protein